MKTEDLAECDLQAGARVALGSSQTCSKCPLGSGSNLSLQPHLLEEFICLVKRRNKKTNYFIQKLQCAACSAVPQAAERIRCCFGFYSKLSPQTLIQLSKAIHSQLLGVQQCQETSQHTAHPPRSNEHFAFVHISFYHRLHKPSANTYQIQFPYSSRETGWIICKFTSELSKATQLAPVLLELSHYFCLL